MRILPLTLSMLVVSYGVLKQHSSVPLFTFLKVRKQIASFLMKTMTISYILCGESRNIFLKYQFLRPLLIIFFSPSPLFASFQSYTLISLSVSTNSFVSSFRTSMICWWMNEIFMLISQRCEDLISNIRALSRDLRRMTVSDSLWTDMIDYWDCSSYLLMTYPDYLEMKPKWLPILERQKRCLQLKQTWLMEL